MHANEVDIWYAQDKSDERQTAEIIPCIKVFGDITLQWRHNEHEGVSNYQPHDCLLNRLFKAQIKENITVPRHCPLWGEFTGDRRIPRTKG